MKTGKLDRMYYCTVHKLHQEIEPKCVKPAPMGMMRMYGPLQPGICWEQLGIWHVVSWKQWWCEYVCVCVRVPKCSDIRVWARECRRHAAVCGWEHALQGGSKLVAVAGMGLCTCPSAAVWEHGQGHMQGMG